MEILRHLYCKLFVQKQVLQFSYLTIYHIILFREKRDRSKYFCNNFWKQITIEVDENKNYFAVFVHKISF